MCSATYNDKICSVISFLKKYGFHSCQIVEKAMIKEEINPVTLCIVQEHRWSSKLQIIFSNIYFMTVKNLFH